MTLVLKLFVRRGWNSQQLELFMAEISLSVVLLPKFICKLLNGSWFIFNVSLNFLLVVIPEPQLSVKELRTSMPISNFKEAKPMTSGNFQWPG